LMWFSRPDDPGRPGDVSRQGAARNGGS
jgi:hypothetical protein